MSTAKTRHLAVFATLTFVALLVLASLASAARAAEFGVSRLDGEVSNEDGSPASQAGSHPWQAFGTAKFNPADDPDPLLGSYRPAESIRDLTIDLPAGLVGNPQAVAQCTSWELFGTPRFLPAPKLNNANCQLASQVGALAINGPVGEIPEFGSAPDDPWGLPSWFALYNMEPPPGKVAAFGANFVGVPAVLTAELDPWDYSVRVTAENVNQAAGFLFSGLDVWGVPADSSHDMLRNGWRGTEELQSLKQGGGQPVPTTEYPGEPDKAVSVGIEPRPFLRNPTSCTPPGVGVETKLHVTSYGGREDSASFFSHLPPPNETEQLGPTGCNQLPFAPTVAVKPTTNLAESPSGLEFDLHLPQNEDVNGLATADLRDAVVTLPAGMTVNPPAADGLDACSPAQVGLITPVGQPDAHFDGAPVRCPDASKLGTVVVSSPPVDHPLGGAVYLASQGQNPFGSLLALYIAIEDPRTGVIVKLPGEVRPDPQSGQLTAIFRNNPQLPVEDLKVDFFGGPRGPLKTPAACGTHTTQTTLTPWSSPEGADATPADSFQLAQGPGGGACLHTGGQAPNSPSFNAGAMDPTAGVFTPFTLSLARADGSQQIKAIDTILPKGLVGKLAGTPYCPDAALAAAAARDGSAEQGSPSCPSVSQVGSVDVGAGAGSTPLHVSGRAYLAGPYKGAPLSLAIVTPAVAGPFDLGTVVVRTAINVDPESAQIRAVSDRIPTILQGIPLNIRSIDVKVDKPTFTLNPTSCNPTAVAGSATSVFDQIAGLSSPFQVGDCGRLGFKPKLTLRLKGGTKRGSHPALRATLDYPKGAYANIARASVALPHSEFLEQSHIRTICTRVQFAANLCPPGSVYGHARAITPLLEQPLEGPVYLRSSSNELPDMVADLNGQIRVSLVGRIDSVRGGIRTTFEGVPDAPVSKFVLEMRGGKKGLLVNSRDICKHVNRATALFDGQNGKTADQRPALKADCRKRKGKGRKRGGKAGGKHTKRR